MKKKYIRGIVLLFEVKGKGSFQMLNKSLLTFNLKYILKGIVTQDSKILVFQ
jgi:hypothetical protein